MEQIYFNDFLSSCGASSTPIMKIHRQNLGVDKDNNIPLTNKELVIQLLEAKEEWPMAFSRVTQNRLNELKLGFDEDFLLKQHEQRKPRRMSPMIINHNRNCGRNSNRDRSMSPSGAIKMKESKWERRSEIAMLLIDHILMKFEDLPLNFLKDQPIWKTQSKQLIDTLGKSIENKTKIEKIRESNLHIIGQSLRIILNKMGMLFPKVISEQILQLKFLRTRSGNAIVKDRSKIEAVQILLLHISTPNRILINKLLEMFRIISKIRKIQMSGEELGKILCQSFFEELNSESIKLCKDMIVLVEHLFLAPLGILSALKVSINTRTAPTNLIIDFPEKKLKLNKPISTPTKPNIKIFHKPTTPITKSISGVPIVSFFPNSKWNSQQESVILTAFNKINSPEQIKKPSVPMIFTPTLKNQTLKRKIIVKSLSPLKWNKKCIVPNLNEFKKRKLAAN
uniref:Tgs-1 n=1 Tax=Schmidtea mediterranea TaxID=79327 RepID=A0A2Z4ELZ5_SCHMD|nr:tgs-1 [Schmidtea mediterranea]